VGHWECDTVSNAIVEGLQSFAGRVKTLTYDNGKEIALHIQINQALKSTGYFARPYASWKQSYSKNINGLLSQYVLKN
jgi:IS30 family transposase